MEELKDNYENEIIKVNEDFAKRGIFESGLRLRAVARLERQKIRDIEKLKLKFGKSGGGWILSFYLQAKEEQSA